MATTLTVQQLITQARVWLQDVDGTRWPDANFVAALNLGLLESLRIRPDFYRATPDTVPQYAVPADLGTAVVFPPGYYPALVYYMTGTIQLQDEEGTEDQRAAVMVQVFTQKLTQAA